MKEYNFWFGVIELETKIYAIIYFSHLFYLFNYLSIVIFYSISGDLKSIEPVFNNHATIVIIIKRIIFYCHEMLIPESIYYMYNDLPVRHSANEDKE